MPTEISTPDKASAIRHLQNQNCESDKTSQRSAERVLCGESLHDVEGKQIWTISQWIRASIGFLFCLPFLSLRLVFQNFP
jgi:hypothetical protein